MVESLTKLDSINKGGNIIPVRLDKHNTKSKEKGTRKVLSEGDLHEEYQCDGM